MQAIVIQAIGDPAQLRLETVSDPNPGPGEVIVQLYAAALNHRDLYICRGQYAGLRFPIIPGSDGVGEVAAVGAEVTNVQVGDQVVINPSLEWGDNPQIQGPRWRILGLPEDGTFAEQVKVPAISLFPRPAELSDEEAAALPLAGLTAYRAVATRGQVQPGEQVLILGIGGGVATFALQIAAALGAEVFVTSSSDEKLDRARQLGAKAGFNYRASNWVQEVRAATGGQGPDVIIDGTGGRTFDQALDAARPGGRVVSYGATTGPVQELQVRRIFWKHLNVLGSTMGSPADFQALLALAASGRLHPVVDTTYPLKEAGKALLHMEEAAQFGKIVLRIR